MMSKSVPPDHLRYVPIELGDETSLVRSGQLYEYMRQRRSIRHFSTQAVDRAVIQNIIETASTAPSGANKQPWYFCVVENAQLKQKIRAAAEKEEYENYHKRMNAAWLADLKPLGTDWHKPFLEIAPYLIVVFKCVYGIQDGEQIQHYYVNESVGLACGMLLAAIHHAGLVALTHTPSPMNFLAEILGRPSNERAFLLIPVGYPAEDATVPNIQRKDFEKIACFY